MISPEPIVEVFAAGSVVRYRKDDVIYRAGEPIGSVQYLTDGFVRLVMGAPGRQGLYAHMMGPGSLIPMLPSVSAGHVPYGFEAMGSVVTRSVGYDAFSTAVAASPGLERYLLEQTSARLNEIVLHIQRLHTGTAREKLLLVLSQICATATGTGRGIPVRVTCSELAAWTDVRRETVSRIVSGLLAEGLVRRTKGGLTISTAAAGARGDAAGQTAM